MTRDDVVGVVAWPACGGDGWVSGIDGDDALVLGLEGVHAPWNSVSCVCKGLCWRRRLFGRCVDGGECHSVSGSSGVGARGVSGTGSGVFDVEERVFMRGSIPRFGAPVWVLGGGPTKSIG